MNAETRHVVTFKSAAFNMTEPKEYFINPRCFGDDVAKWLISALRQRNVQTDDSPGQEDFGWYFNFSANDTSHTFVISHRPGGPDEIGLWIGWLERNRGIIGSILGGRRRGIDPAAAEMVNAILSQSPEIREVRWHFQSDFDKGQEENGTPTPLFPS